MAIQCKVNERQSMCKAGSILKPQNGLTKRAPDLGYAPRFFGIRLALGVSRFDGESTLPPQAGNANR